MSYILEALKRADRERQRGIAPDIHAQPEGLPNADHRERRRRLPWAGVLLGGALGLALTAGWQYWVRSSPVQTVASPATIERPTPSRPPSVAASAAAVAQAPPVPKSAAPAAPAAPIRMVPPVVAAAPFLAAPAVRPASQPPELLTLQTLPESAKRLISTMKLGGAIHSARAADRLLIVDGQVLREGDQVAAEVVLEQIQPRSAIFRVQQHRVEVPY